MPSHRRPTPHRPRAGPRIKKAQAAKVILAALKLMRRPVSAYEIQASLSDRFHLAPPTIYRALDMLMDEGLVHKIQSLNAFVACRHVGHADRTAFAICTECGSVMEICGSGIDAILESCSHQLGFELHESNVELHGACKKCSTSEKVRSD
ncbi:MAG: transcriptional repressor [Proteobacteria bacterium]|nr:transcriptional repressor [Pseudomonadota bacterium]